MLTAIHLGNFKAFALPVRVPIRPITLVFGPNSAGKSSLIHSLALGHEGTRLKGKLDIGRTKLGGDAIDLGGFRQYIHRRALDQRVTWGIEIRTDHGSPYLLPGIDRFLMRSNFGLPLDDEARPLSRAKPTLDSYQLSLDDEAHLRMSRRPDGRLRIDELTPSLAKLLRRFKGGAPGLSEGGRAWSDAELQKSVLDVVALPAGLFPELPGDASGLMGLVGALQQILLTVERYVKVEVGRLSYLGPLRSYPPRHMAFTEQEDANWAAGGGRAWDQMRKSKRLRDAVNAWLGSKERLQTPYKIALRRFVAPLTAQSAIGAAIDGIWGKLSVSGERTDDASPLDRWDRDEFVNIVTQKLLHDRNMEGDADLVLVDMRTNTTVSHRDVGIGISQVLPVLVEAYGSEGRIVAIEQPEIHLHPRLQAELADVFISSALGKRKNTFLLETHSEHLILRVLRRIRETAQGRLPEGLSPVRPEDVAVIFVVPDGTGTQIVEIPITAEGEFARPWPGGFFPERMKELY